MNDDEDVLHGVFNKYDTGSVGYLSLQQFTLLVTRLGRYVPEISGVELSAAQSAFALFDSDGDGKLSYTEFKNWWGSKDKYSFFGGEKAILLRKAYRLYTQYTKGDAAMTVSEFSEMMEKLEIPYKEIDFDLLDKNTDGIISFREFCVWLNWF